MKKGVKILLCILVILVAAAAGVCVWQWVFQIEAPQSMLRCLITSRQQINQKLIILRH